MKDGKTATESYAETLERKEYMSDPEGATYVGLSLPTFRVWSEKIGARRKIGGRYINIRKVMDKKIMEGDLD